MTTARIEIPRTPDAITPEWLTDALRSGGAITAASVTSADIEVVGAGSGFIGQLARVKLTYDRPEPGAPAAVIAKMPAVEPQGRAIGMMFRFYERESRFYDEIAGEISLRTPRCYYNGRDLEAGEFVLLLEDLGNCQVGDHLESCALDQARLLITEIAKFHAAWWESPRLETLTWMPLFNDPVNLSAEPAYQNAWPSFCGRFASQVPAATMATAERLSTRIAKMLNGMTGMPRTIAHGDFRLDNMFFGDGANTPPLTIIDWQIAYRGIGTFDLAYFMSGNLTTVCRRENEQELLRLYQETLVGNGVRGYSFDSLMHDYRYCTLFCLVYNVIGAGDLDPANDRGMAMWKAWVDRTGAAISDLRADELMPA